MSQLRKQFSRNCTHYNYKVILLGDYGVGKTSLFRRIKNVGICSRQLQRQDSRLTSAVYQDTIDYCSRTFTLQDGKRVQVDFWDTGNAERYRGSLTGNYYKGATGIILMYDATDPSSLTSLRTWMDDAQSYTYNATFLLLGNKYDDSDDANSASGSSYQVDDDLSKAFATHKEIPLHFKISTQCSNEETLTNVFQSLVEQMHRQMERQYWSAASRGGGDYPLTCTTCTDTVHLIATETNTNTQSSCTPCSRR